MLFQLFHPATRVATVGVDPKLCLKLRIHLVDYVLEGNHAVFEHPVPGEFLSVTTVVQIDVLPTISIYPGGHCGMFDLVQDRLPFDDRVAVCQENALETVGEVVTAIIIPGWPLVKNLLHDIHVYKSPC